ncbi:MAG: hypothetical protein KDD82_00430 [Planctomycetes bacterium]|nr:hypothetical protein [Planctomycetota bacterium]
MEKTKKTPTQTLDDAKATGQRVLQAYVDAYTGAANHWDELAKGQLKSAMTFNEQALAAVNQTATALLEANATARKASMELVGSAF